MAFLESSRFLSLGLQLITERWIFETSLQVPIVQELDGHRYWTTRLFSLRAFPIRH